MDRRPRSVNPPGSPGHQAPIPAAARVGNLLCSSGIAGKNADGSLPADAEAQAENAFAAMRELLAAGGCGMDDVARLTVYIADEAVRSVINAQWLRHFPDPADRPARHILSYPLQHGMLLQLEFIAAAP